MASISQCVRWLGAGLGLLLLAGSLGAQSDQEQAKQSLRQAAREFLSAKDAAAVEKFLTNSAQQVLERAAPSQRHDLLMHLLLTSPENMRGKLQWREGEQPIVRTEYAPERDVFEISVERVEIQDGKATVELGVKRWYQGKPAPEDWSWPRRASFQARLEDGRWRLVSFTVWSPEKDTFVLDGPGLEALLTSASEASAVGSLRTLNTAEVAYFAIYANAGFTCSLADLGGGGSGTTDAHHAGLIDDVLASGKKSGYLFTLSGCPAKPNPPVEYTITAVPAEPGRGRAFCTDQTAVIYYAQDGKGETCLAEKKPLQ